MRASTITEVDGKEVVVLARDDRKVCPRCGQAWDRHKAMRRDTSRRAIRRLDAKGKLCPR